MSRLWDRGVPLHEVVERFTVGRDPELDRQIAAHDALGTAAHALMLARVGVLRREDSAAAVRELGAIAADARAGQLRISAADEDCHTAIENRLTERLGDVGRRIHTGRSRNDQVIAALRLWGREAVLRLLDGLLRVAGALADLAEAHREVAVPGYTHTRQAMPSTLGLLFGAHGELIADMAPWLQQAFAHLDRSPLGSASGYGVALPLDRQHVADLLRFSSVQVNTLAVQNDRGRAEYLVLATAAAAITDLGRLATDLIWFSTEELAYVSLGDEVTTGSSIMPQKRNPDVLELVRATAARLRARQAEVGGVYGPLASGYQRDLQHTKEPFLEGLQLAVDAAAAMQAALAALRVHPDRCRGAMTPAIGATDVVYDRVARGEPFRSAYKAVAAEPDGAVAGREVAELWRRRTHLGAPGALDLSSPRARLQQARAWHDATAERIAEAWLLLER